MTNLNESHLYRKYADLINEAAPEFDSAEELSSHESFSPPPEAILRDLTLDGFWKAAANSGYSNERGSGAGGGWHSTEHADKEALHFKGMGKNSKGQEEAYYDMVWWNPDEETMEQSGVVVTVGDDGKFYGEFSGVSEPIMRMNEDELFEHELAEMKRIMAKK